MALSAGYLTSKQAQIWDLKKKGLPESNIARELHVTRQTVHKAVDVANSKIAQALVETAKLNKIKVRNIDAEKGILLGHSPEFRTPVVITFSARNGVQVWYKHEGDCKRCDQLETCRKTLLTEMEDRNIQPDEDIDLNLPSKLAELLFKRIMEEQKVGVREKLWYYCPRPLKHKSHFFERVTIPLHIPSPKTIRTPHIFPALVSFTLSLTLFYIGMFISVCLITGTTIGIGVLAGNAVLIYFSILFFALLWAGVDSFLSVIRKKGVRALLAAILLLVVVPAALAGSLNNGLFDSVALLDGSLIDLHNCKVSLNIRNDGAKELKITKIEVGNLLVSQEQRSLKRGESHVFTIGYPDPGVFHESFKEGNHPVIIHTDGVLTYRFEVEARFSKHEEVEGVHAQIIGLKERTVGGQHTYFPSINVTFDIPGFDYIDYITVYSVDVGNLSLRLDPPSTISPTPVYNGPKFLYQLNLYFVDGQYRAESAHAFPNVIPSQPLDTSIFKLGETYNVTVRTMENNNYTTSVTLTK